MTLRLPLLFGAVLLAAPLTAQTTSAQLTGRITDPSGSVVPGARIAAVNADTGARRDTASNADGYYAVPLLDPGNYRILVEMQGFKPIEQAGVTLHVNQSARMDFALQIGTGTETITVRGDAPLLDANESALGAVVDNAKLVNLPLNGRNAYDLVLLTPGTQQYGRPDMPGNHIPLSNMSINGGPAMTNEFLLDGIPNQTVVQSQFVAVPSIDAVQEFKVQTNSLAAEFGRTGGGVINLTLKSGTNQFHGVLYEFLRNDKFDANGFFNNRSAQEKPPFRYNQFGGSLGGPVRKDNTFFFFNYEGLRRTQSRTRLINIPTAAMRSGDFSGVFTDAGQLVQIFDPMTTKLTADGRNRTREAFPGNRVPVSRMDPVALKMLPYWPAPNLPGNPRTGASNFISTAPERFNTNQINARVDHTLSQNHRMFGRVSWDEKQVDPPNIFENIANPSSGPQLFTTRTAGLHDTWTINPTTLGTFRLGLNRLIDSGYPYGKDFDITQLGFPASYRNFQTAVQFPQIQITGMNVGNLGFGTSTLGPVNSALLHNPQNTYTGQTDYTLIRGRHVIKFGADARVFRVHGRRPSNGGGNFNFTTGFTQGPDPTRAGPTSGNAFASFLMGTPSGGGIAVDPTQDFQSWYAGMFVQDDFKITPKLTLNFGLRWEPESYRTDRYDRLVSLDFKALSPLKAPELGRPVLGGASFAGVNGNPRDQADMAWQNWGPRFGFAYSASRRLVVRGGYGMFYAPRVWRGIGFGQQGFSADTPFVASVDGFVPTHFLSNPFPDGFNSPPGRALGLMTYVGQALNAPDRRQNSPNVQQWNLGVQNVLPGEVLLEVVYAGSKGSRLPGNLEFNQIPDQYLSLGNDLLRLVPNPFYGQIPANTSLGVQTVILGQLLRPFPQFTAFTAPRSTAGSSSYHSMQLRAEKRMASGLSMLLSYTAGKLIDDGSPGVLNTFGPVPGYQNNNNRKLERSISSQETPQRVVTSIVYELPLGRGKLLGGWQVNGILTAQKGRVLELNTASNPTLGRIGAGGLRPDNNGKSAELSGAAKNRLDRYFDTSVFSQPAPWQFGTTARTLPDARVPGVVNVDFSLVKNTRLMERHMLQFRAEFFNVANHTNFGAPGETFGTANFGVITSAGAARIIQFGMKWYF